MLINDCPLVEVEGTPAGMTALRDVDGKIVFWDGRRQYHTGASEDGEELRRAMAHHFGPNRGPIHRFL